jgi:hypothetical protein
METAPAPYQAVFTLVGLLVEVCSNSGELMAGITTIWRRFAGGDAVQTPAPRRYALVDRSLPIGRTLLPLVERSGLADAPLEAGRFLLLAGDRVISLSSHAGELVDYLDWAATTDALTTATRYGIFHSAVLACAGRGLLLPAVSGSGKTTLAAALVRAGFGYLSDEAALVDPATRRVFAYPKPFSVKQPAVTARLLALPAEVAGRAPAELGQVWHLDPDLLASGCLRDETAVTTIVFPRYAPGQPTALAPLSRTAASLALLQNGVNAAARPPCGVGLAAALAGGAACYRLTVSDLPAAVRLIAGLFEPDGPATATGGLA